MPVINYFQPINCFYEKEMFLKIESKFVEKFQKMEGKKNWLSKILSTIDFFKVILMRPLQHPIKDIGCKTGTFVLSFKKYNFEKLNFLVNLVRSKLYRFL